MKKENKGFLSFMLTPRTHIQSVITNKSIAYIMLVSFLAIWATNILGSFQSYNYELVEDSFEYQSAFELLIESALYSIGEIILGIALYAGIVWLIGKLFKGKGKFFDLYKASLMTVLPFTILLPILAIWLVISPESFYGMTEQTVVEMIFLVIIIILTLFSVVISTIYCIVMVSEIHQITKWQAFFVICITMMIFLILLIIVIVIIVIIIVIYEALK